MDDNDSIWLINDWVDAKLSYLQAALDIALQTRIVWIRKLVL